MEQVDYDGLRTALYRATNLTSVQRHHLRRAVDAYERSRVSKYSGIISVIVDAQRNGLELHVATRNTCAEHIAAGDDGGRSATPEQEEVPVSTG